MILYNEIDPHAAGWLRNLAAAGRIAPGRVDDRSITEIRPDDLRGVRQFHAFAGIGLWSVALRLAGVPDLASVWTGSAPCQPFSTAGSEKGTDDDRHLAPHFLALVGEHRPQFVFGEQVTSPLGRSWFESVFTHLEGLGYVVGASILPASGVGAPHARERIFFGAVAVPGGERREDHRILRTAGGPVPQGLRDRQDDPGPGRDPGRVGVPRTPGGLGEAWQPAEWRQFSDGGYRPLEPGIHPLAYGGPRRLATFRALGNAIVPQIAAEFVAAFIESADEIGAI